MDVRFSTTPIVAIVGRTNVGKSTLFNKLLGRKTAVTSASENTTQDVKFGLCTWQRTIFTVIDTAGLDMSMDERSEEALRRQATRAMEKADVILFVVDGTTGVMPQDTAMAKHLRGTKKRVVLVVNKADNPRQRAKASGGEWRKFGFGDPMLLSANNGSGVGDMLDVVVEAFATAQKQSAAELPPVDVRVTLLGRPNVGKSSLLNALAGEDRVIVSDVPHTTKEPQDTLVRYEMPDGSERQILVIDTVGIRKKARVEHGMESLGVHLSIEEMRRADVAFIVIDAEEGMSLQDKKLASLVEDKNVGVAFIVNKWDLAGDDSTGSAQEFRANIQRSIPSLAWAPVLFVSAKTGRNVRKILDVAIDIAQQRMRQIPQEELDAFFARIKQQHGRLIKAGENKPKVYGITRSRTIPPEFTVVVKRKAVISTGFLRFIANRLREEFGFEGVPIKVMSRDISLR